MNKILKLLAAATLIALTTAACQKEKLFDSQTAGEQTVTFTVKTDAAATKATADGDGSGAGLTRCLVAVYMKTGDPAQPYKLYDTPTATGSGLNYTFTVNLIRKQTYQIVVWADKGMYTVPNDLSSVTRIADDKACNSDAYDAFYASTEFVQGTTTTTAITATRPFAQLNLITKDLNENFQPGAVSVTYSSPQSFNPFDGTVSADMTEVTYTADSPYYTSTTGTNATQHTLVMNYLFAAAGDQTILPSVKMTAKLTVDAEIEVANVPVKRNYRTNIIGNLLTEQTDFTITVDPAWSTPEIDVEWVSVATVADANYALEHGKTNVAIESVESNSVILLPETPNTIGISLPSGNANAVTIKYETSNESGQTPNLNVAAGNNTGDLVINAPQSHVTLNGATYNNVTASTSNTTLVVEEGVTIENLTVNQGAVEIYGTVNSIALAEGCKIKVWAVGDEATFNTALAKGAKTIQLKNDISAWDTVCLISHDLAVNGKGYTITGSATRLFRITTENTVVKFNDINLVNTSTNEDARCISFDNTSSNSSLYVENCSLTDPEGKAIFATPASNLLIDIKDSEISAWAAINITANNSTINVTNSVLKGKNPKQVVSEAVTYGTIVFDGANNQGRCASNNRLNIYNSTIYAIEPNENTQVWLALQSGAQNNIIKLDEATRCLNGNDESIFNTKIIIDHSYDVNSEIWIGSSFVYPGYAASIGSNYYVTLAEALAAVQAGETVQILKSGEYTLEKLTGANYTLEAVAEGVVLKHTPGYGFWIAECTGTVTIKNLTWDVGVANYQYFQNVDVENCTIKGCPFGHTKAKFKSCEFVVESSNDYNIWTYGADIVFDDCTFNCAGKSVLVYREGGDSPNKVTLNNCVFNASQPVEGKAAIEIDSSLAPYEVYINNCSQTGFANGSVSQNPLWNNKKGDSTNLKVVVDGVQQTL